MKEEAASVTLEVNTNSEWVRVFSGVDFSEIPEEDEEAAADDFTSALFRHLEDVGFAVERAKGQRTLLHGWNGANTFAHKIGPVGTFYTLTEEQITLIESAIESAEAEMQRDWSEQNTEAS